MSVYIVPKGSYAECSSMASMVTIQAELDCMQLKIEEHLNSKQSHFSIRRY